MFLYWDFKNRFLSRKVSPQCITLCVGEYQDRLAVKVTNLDVSECSLKFHHISNSDMLYLHQSYYDSLYALNIITGYEFLRTV